MGWSDRSCRSIRCDKVGSTAASIKAWSRRETARLILGLLPSADHPSLRRRHTDFQDPPLGSLSFHAITWQKRRLFPVSRSRERVNTLLQLHDYDDDDDDNVRLCTRTAVAFTLVASATGYARTLGPPPPKKRRHTFCFVFLFQIGLMLLFC